jgi:hypothetical protein
MDFKGIDRGFYCRMFVIGALELFRRFQFLVITFFRSHNHDSSPAEKRNFNGRAGALMMLNLG